MVCTPETYNDPIFVYTQPYNPGQNSWDTNATVHQIEASSLPPFPPPPSPSAVLTLYIQVLIQDNQHCLGERGTEITPYNNIPKHF